MAIGDLNSLLSNLTTKVGALQAKAKQADDKIKQLRSEYDKELLFEQEPTEDTGMDTFESASAPTVSNSRLALLESELQKMNNLKATFEDESVRTQEQIAKVQIDIFEEQKKEETKDQEQEKVDIDTVREAAFNNPFGVKEAELTAETLTKANNGEILNDVDGDDEITDKDMFKNTDDVLKQIRDGRTPEQKKILDIQKDIDSLALSPGYGAVRERMELTAKRDQLISEYKAEKVQAEVAEQTENDFPNFDEIEAEKEYAKIADEHRDELNSYNSALEEYEASQRKDELDSDNNDKEILAEKEKLAKEREEEEADTSDIPVQHATVIKSAPEVVEGEGVTADGTGEEFNPDWNAPIEEMNDDFDTSEIDKEKAEDLLSTAKAKFDEAKKAVGDFIDRAKTNARAEYEAKKLQEKEEAENEAVEQEYADYQREEAEVAEQTENESDKTWTPDYEYGLDHPGINPDVIEGDGVTADGTGEEFQPDWNAPIDNGGMKTSSAPEKKQEDNTEVIDNNDTDPTGGDKGLDITDEPPMDETPAILEDEPDNSVTDDDADDIDNGAEAAKTGEAPKAGETSKAGETPKVDEAQKAGEAQKPQGEKTGKPKETPYLDPDKNLVTTHPKHEIRQDRDIIGNRKNIDKNAENINKNSEKINELQQKFNELQKQYNELKASQGSLQAPMVQQGGQMVQGGGQPVQVVQQAGSSGGGILSKIGSFIGNVLSFPFKLIGNIAGGIGNTIGGLFNSGNNNNGTVVYTTAAPAPVAAQNGGAVITSTPGGFVTTAAAPTAQAPQQPGFFSRIGNGICDVAGSVWDGAKTVGSTLWKPVDTLVTGTSNLVGAGADRVASWIKPNTSVTYNGQVANVVDIDQRTGHVTIMTAAGERLRVSGNEISIN